MRPIAKGDKVKALWNQPEGGMLEGIIIAEPTEGDELWYMQTGEGSIHAINTRSASFDAFWKEAPNHE